VCEEKVLMNAKQIEEAINTISNSIMKEFGDISNVAIVGIQTRGV